MAVKKTPSETKAKDASASKPKASAKKTVAKKGAAPKTTATTKAAAPKKAAVKKAAPAPIKLSTSQAEMLQKVSSAAETGYLLVKKAEQKTLDALQDRKLIKKGAKDKESGSFRYLISSAGKKHLESSTPPSTPPPSPPTTPPSGNS